MKKKIKLMLLKLEYYFSYYAGPYTVNERKYTRFLQYLIKLQTEIQELESEIKNKNN
jgi:hypothetical protein